MAKNDKDLAVAQEATVESPNMMQVANRKLADAEGRRKKLIATYQAQDKVPMYLSPMYRAYFGNVMPVSINGITIYFKVDGSTQMVPQAFADEITSKRMQVDAILTKQRKMADIPSNLESAPGELRLF